MGTTGDQLDKWCVQNGVRGWKGVYTSDQLPTLWRPKDWCAVLNHSPSTSPTGGTHWLGVRINGSTATFFDSYALPPTNNFEDALMGAPTDAKPHFQDWLDRCGVTSVQSNHRRLQQLTSAVCGQYSVWYCKWGLPANDPPHWSWVTNDFKQNDRIIKSLVKLSHV